ncbi:MAG: hypothetical protein Q9170_007282 [Blastenia crenularia]
MAIDGLPFMMAPLDTPWSKADAARERELLRYFEPPDSTAKPPAKATRHNLSIETEDALTANAPSSPETTLTALAQLCALRLNGEHLSPSLHSHSTAELIHPSIFSIESNGQVSNIPDVRQIRRMLIPGISVIGKETQYFIAEATKTLDLIDNQVSDAEGDALWFGCGSVDKSGRLCERTIELPASHCFTVTDLSQDERFNQLPFVTGPPHFRFYAGTPLTTRNGVNIGSLFILDDMIRPRLTLAQERFLGTIAATITSHMEVNREAEERRKVLRMAKGLNAFVEGKRSFDPGNEVDTSTIRPVDEASYDTENGLANIEGAHKATFSRAASLLDDSLSLRNHGGVVFLDTVIGPQHMAVRRTERKDFEPGSESDAKESPRKSRREQLRDRYDHASERSTEDRIEKKMAEVISSSCSRLTEGTSTGRSFTPPDEQILQSLLKHYPRGKVWIFDGAEGLLTSEEDDTPSADSAANGEQGRRRVYRKQAEKEILKQCFPNVYELIFVPLWDAGTSRWFSGCFCWRTSVNRKFSIEAELQFVTAFGNSIMAEISRLGSIYESRQKGDFIGSISHELRSPLHGILGSCEFLAETDFDTFQSSLVDTISSCGRTLLDTIEHILDFSKINSFERNWRNARKPKTGHRPSINESTRRTVAKDAPPLMSIFAVTDVAAIVEEVVEGVYAGQVYRDFGSADITDVSAGQRGRTADRGLSMSHQSQLGGLVEQKSFKNIEVILNIEQGEYCFATQPGALRRIIMNVFGNSLKYTTAGEIMVRLRLEVPEALSDVQAKNRILDITVTDTGKGISSDYLRTSLYTAFSQEDVLANGTGLGLSIVRSIVSMLDGTIDIKSHVGQGTEVQIRIPLSREAGGDTPSTPSSAGSQPQENSVTALQTDYPTKGVSIYRPDRDDASAEHEIETIKMATYYITNWLTLQVKPDPQAIGTDVVVVGEHDLPELLKQLPPGPAVVVLCTTTHRLQVAQSLYRGAIEFMSTPFGPYKLAKAIRSSLEKANELAAGRTPQLRPTRHGSRISESDSVLPGFESVSLGTDNEDTPMQVQTNGIVTASQSSNARMALNTPSSGASTESRNGFPFPIHSSSNHSGNESPHSAFGDMMRQDSSRPTLSSRKTEPVFRPTFAYTSALTKQGQLATVNAHEKREKTVNHPSAPKPEPSSTEAQQQPDPVLHKDSSIEKRPPRLLLVDDNKINLRLLETFMRKRKYQFVDSVADGSLAVEAAKIQEQGYDIIFMDLSMPVMNGFEATRAIRDLELERNRDPTTQPLKPAMIIALTGLASGRDHGEAFACGVDLCQFSHLYTGFDRLTGYGRYDETRLFQGSGSFVG